MSLVWKMMVVRVRRVRDCVCEEKGVRLLEEGRVKVEVSVVGDLLVGYC